MSDVAPSTPKIRCDNCNHIVEKVRTDKDFTKVIYKRPDNWGSVTVSTTDRGRYPNTIIVNDLCNDCLKIIHIAMGGALESARDERNKKSMEILKTIKEDEDVG